MLLTKDSLDGHDEWRGNESPEIKEETGKGGRGCLVEPGLGLERFVIMDETEDGISQAETEGYVANATQGNRRQHGQMPPSKRTCEPDSCSPQGRASWPFGCGMAMPADLQRGVVCGAGHSPAKTEKGKEGGVLRAARLSCIGHLRLDRRG